MVDDTSGFINDVLDDLDLSDPAAVTSSVTSILSVMNPPPPSPVNLHNSYGLSLMVVIFLAWVDFYVWGHSFCSW